MKKGLFCLTAFIIILSLYGPANAEIFAAEGALKTDTMLHDPAPAFTLKDVNGKTVSLSDFAGKILVIDFWATWCAPCKKSFPAMQATLDRYKNDPDVKFIFIDTWEKSDDYVGLVGKFLAENHYTFNVLFDEEVIPGIRNEIYNLYEVNGIPTKIIIDRKGLIRYKIGYHEVSSVDNGVKELSDMIEAVRMK